MASAEAAHPRPLRVLLDAAAFDLRDGTGVSTYARSLEGALQANGHEVERLFGRDVATSPDNAAEAVSFFSTPHRPGGRVGRRLHALSTRWDARWTSTRRARVLDLAHVVPDHVEALPRQVHNAHRLHELAQLRHTLTHRFTAVRTPAPFDVFHLPYPAAVRVPGARQVVTVHDLIPLRLPYVTLDRPREVTARFRTSVRLAELVLTISQSSRTDLINLLGVPDEKIAVTPLSCSLPRLTRSEGAELPRLLARHGLTPDGYLLFVGAVEPKKNLRRLIEAYGMADVGLPLVLAGPDGWLVEQELAPLREGRVKGVIRTGFLPRDELRALYAGARAFVFPSLYEGFGLPLLEALSFGLPALTSSASSLPEVGGEACLYVDPYDVRAIRGGLEALAGDAALRARLSAAAPRQAALFSVGRHRRALAEAYGRLGRHP